MSTSSASSLQASSSNSPITSAALLQQHASAPNPLAAALEQAVTDRNALAGQNSSLWKLVEKQRAGYSQILRELERVRGERDTWRARAGGKRDDQHQGHSSNNPDNNEPKHSTPRKSPDEQGELVMPLQVRQFDLTVMQHLARRRLLRCTPNRILRYYTRNDSGLVQQVPSILFLTQIPHPVYPTLVTSILRPLQSQTAPTIMQVLHLLIYHSLPSDHLPFTLVPPHLIRIPRRTSMQTIISTLIHRSVHNLHQLILSPKASVLYRLPHPWVSRNHCGRNRCQLLYRQVRTFVRPITQFLLLEK